MVFLLACSQAWLVIGLLFGVISSIKLHGPGFLSGSEWLAYGRIYPAAQNALAYGFAAQALLGVGLWILARLGRVTLQGAGIPIVGGIFWNLSVALGLLGILAGHNTAYDWLEMPRYASGPLFFSYLLIAICAIMTFKLRRECALYVSQWYLLAALLWFPWIYSTAQLLLIIFPVRGVLQAVVNGWFVQNLFDIWLGSLGLAAIFYFLPKTLDRPLHSRYLALFGFWALLFFGSWGGMYAGAPVPKWLGSLSIVFKVMTLIPLLAVGLNLYRTMAGKWSAVKTDAALGFVALGALCYLLVGVVGILSVLRTVSERTLFTLFTPGMTNLYLFGFVALTVAGAMYYIVPRLLEAEWPSGGTQTFHFWTSVAGIALVTLPLLFGGLTQGAKLNDPQAPFISVVRSIIPFLGLSTLGGTLLLIGNAALLGRISKAMLATCCGSCCPGLLSASQKPRALASGGKV